MSQKFSFNHLEHEQIHESSFFKVLIELDQAHFPYPWSEHDWHELPQKYSSVLTVSFEQKRLIGLALTLGQKRESVVHLVKILISPDFRGQGLSSLLLSKHLERLRQREHQSLYLEVEESNNRALGLYHKHEFLVLRTLKDFYGEGRDALAMAYDLWTHIDKTENT